MAEKKDRPTPEQLAKAYKAGLFSKAEYDDKRRRLAHENLEEMIGDKGLIQSYFIQTAKVAQSHWENFIELVDDYKPAQAGTKQQNTPGAAANEALQTLKNAGYIAFDIAGAIMAPFTAFSDVNGATVERWARDGGLSPGWSKFLGTVADVGSNFVPIGKGYQLFARGVQQNFPQIAAGAGKIAGAAKTVSAASTASSAGRVAGEVATKLADDAIAVGLKAEGIQRQGLEAFVDDASKVAGQIEPQVDDFYKALRKYHSEIKDVTETKHLKEIEAEADKLSIHLDDLKALVGSEGKALTPAEIRAYLKTLDQPTTELIENARKVLKGDAVAALRQDKLLTEYFAVTPTFRRAEVEAGRTVKVLDSEPRMKSVTNMMAAWDPDNIAKLNIDAARRTIAEDLVGIANEPEKLKRAQLLAQTVTEETGSANWWAKVKEGFSGGLLLRPITWVRQFLGNTLSATVNVAEHELAGWLSLDQAKGAVKGEGVAAAKGMQAAVGEALSAFAAAHKHTAETAGRFDVPIHKIGGPFGRVINFGHDNIMGIDSFFKALNRNAELYSAAYRGAVHAGLEPGTDAFVDHVIRRRLLPGAEVLESAEATAKSLTFQQELGQWGKATQKFLQYGPLFLYNPYMKSPMNLIKWGWNHTPGLQLASRSLYEDILAGGTRADMAVAKLTLSTIFGNFIFSLAQDGLLTGGGPTDPTLRRSWIANKQPYSYTWNGRQYSIQNTAEPGTTPAELIADYAEMRNQLDDPTAEQTWTAIALSLTRNVLDNTWWRSMSQLVDITAAARGGEEIGKRGAELIFSPLIALATGGPLGQAIERSIDPVRRETRSWIDNVKNGPLSRVLGFGKDAPPVRDGYADPIIIPQALGSEWIRKNVPGGDYIAALNNVGNPFVTRPEETDPVKKEGGRLQVSIPAFPWAWGKVRDDFDIRAALPGDKLPVELSMHQRDRWQVIYRSLLRSPEIGIAAKVLNTEKYQGATDAAKREMFMNYMAEMRGAAKAVLIREDKDLQAKVFTSKVERVLPLLNEDERARTEARAAGAMERIEQAPDLLDSLEPEQRQKILRWGVLDTGETRDQEVIHQGIRGEINKSIPELNRAASPAPAAGE